MSFDQVKTILGGGPGDYGIEFTLPTAKVTSFILPANLKESYTCLWLSGEFAVFVVFDVHDNVRLIQTSDVVHFEHKGFYFRGRQLLPEPLRERLGWKKGKATLSKLMRNLKNASSDQ